MIFLIMIHSFGVAFISVIIAAMYVSDFVGFHSLEVETIFIV